MTDSVPTPRHVILCDATGTPTGTAEILAAHTGAGFLHLAFSAYVFTPDRGALLIQQRSAKKMLWPLVWANTCCSHPREGEDASVGVHRRLHEELGMGCELTPGPEFVYRAEDPHGSGVEHEFDITWIGFCQDNPVPNPEEVADWRWVPIEALHAEMRDQPESFAPWFHLGLPRVLAHLRDQS